MISSRAPNGTNGTIGPNGTTRCCTLEEDSNAVSAWEETGLGKHVRLHALRNPGAKALVDGDETWTYADLDAMARVLANRLYRQGRVLPEEAIGIIVQPGKYDILAQVAVMYVGGTCVPLDATLPTEVLQERISVANISRFLCDTASRDKCAQFMPLVIDNDAAAEGAEESKYTECVNVNVNVNETPWLRDTGPEGRTHLLFTSGTTSKPKAVQILAKSILEVAFYGPFTPLQPHDVVAHVNNTSFDVSLYDIWAPLSRGASIVVIPKAVLLNPPELAAKISEYGITFLPTTTAVLNLAAATFPKAFACLDTLMIGGEAANKEAIRTILTRGPPRRLINAYGPTETCVFALAHSVTMDDLISDTTVSIGKPTGRTAVYILDSDSLAPVPDGQVGELFIAGSGLSRGYLDLPDHNARAFLEIQVRSVDKLRHKTVRAYRTGDLVRRMETGNIVFVGRRDNQVKIRGFRIELEMIESAVLETDQVSAVAAMKLESEEAGAGGFLVAFVVPKQTVTDGSDNMTKAAISQSLARKLPLHMIPQVELVTALPLGPHDKIDRSKLKRTQLEALEMQRKRRLAARATAVAATADAEEPETTIFALKSIWRAVLGLVKPDIIHSDDFFDMGGTSLQAAVLVHQIRESFNVDISSIYLYENSTLGAMATLIDRKKQGQKLSLDGRELWVKDTYLADDMISQILHASGADVLLHRVLDWTTPDEGRVFLTGGTGFVGVHMLASLLPRDSVKRVACLVRSQDVGAGRERIRAALDKYRLWEGYGERFFSKVWVICGDLEDSSLGLGLPGFRSMGEWASVVFHVGAHVNYIQPYSTHRPANVVGTVNAVRLAVTGRLKSLQYMSTISAFGPTGLINKIARVGEDESLDQHLACLPYDHGYAQSQWVVEQMLRRCMARGLPAAIYRPGFVTGSTVSGVSNPDDFMARLVQSCLATASFPVLPSQWKEFVPVDYLCHVVLTIAASPASLGRAYNIVPEHRQRSADMAATFALIQAARPESDAAAAHMTGLPYAEWLAETVALGHPRLKPMFPMLQEKVYRDLTRWELYRDMPLYDTTNTKMALAAVGLEFDCPDIDLALMRRYMEHWSPSPQAT